MFFEKTVWRVSRRWLTRRHECTLLGISKRCHGACCTHKGFWPPSAYGGVCGHLGPKGCDLDQKHRPVVCSLFPLRLVKGMLVLHIRSTYEKGVCQGNHRNGPLLIDALKPSLVGLFGQDEYNRVRADLEAGKNSYFLPSESIVKRMRDEEELAAQNKKVRVPRKVD